MGALRQRFVDELLAREVLPRAQLDAAVRACAATASSSSSDDAVGELPALLVERGARASDVLDALSAAAGVPRAPVSWLRKPQQGAAKGFDGDLLWRLGAVPLGVFEGQWVIAYARVDEIAHASAMGLPPHRAVLALESEVRAALIATVGGPPAVDTLPAEGKDASPPLDPTEILDGGDGVFQPLPAEAAGAEQGARLDDYALGGALGKGGMATVFRAVERATGRQVAIKLMQPHLSSDEYFVERFRREARAAQSLLHENVVDTLAFGLSGGQHFMVTELVDGGTVLELLARMGAMPAALAARIIADVLRGLEAAHARGILHRDLKPGNLLVSSLGVVKIADFGIAKDQTTDDASLTRTGALVGTPAYMSPEQAMCEELDARSDLFSTGVVLYELLTGVNPFHAEKPATTLFKIAAARPPHIFEACAGVPAQLERVVTGLLARARDARYPSAAAALEELAPLLAHLEEAHPRAVVDALRDPRATKKALAEEQAAAELARGRALLGLKGGDRRSAAAVAAFRARAVDVDNEDARLLLDELTRSGEIYLGPPKDKRIVEAEAALEITDEPPPGQLRRLAELYRAEGNPYRAAVYLKRYLMERPSDSHAATQLFALVGGDKGAAPAPFAPLTVAPPSSTTKDIMAGIQTGGFRAQARAPGAPVAQAAPRVVPLAKRHDEGPVTPLALLAGLWAANGKLLAVVALAAGALWLVVGGVGAFIDRSQRDISTAMDKQSREQASLAEQTAAETFAEERYRYIEQARAHARKQELVAAAGAYNRALKLQPIPVERVELHIELARIQERMGARDAAIATLTRALVFVDSKSEVAARARAELARLGSSP